MHEKGFLPNQQNRIYYVLNWQFFGGIKSDKKGQKATFNDILKTQLDFWHQATHVSNIHSLNY